MTFNYTLTKDELINFHKKHILNTLQYKKFINEIKKYYFLISTMILIAVEYNIKFKVFVGLIITGILLFIIRKKIYLYWFQIKLMILYCDYKKKYLFCPITLIFNNEGILLDTSMNNELIKWKGIKDFTIIDRNIFIRTFTKDNIFIPSYAIKSRETLTLLKELFMKYGEIEPKNIYPKDMEFIIK